MIKVFVLFLFIRSGTSMANGPAIEVGSYSSMQSCREAADTSMMKPDEDPREWQPFVGQWLCVERGASLMVRQPF